MKTIRNIIVMLTLAILTAATSSAQGLYWESVLKHDPKEEGTISRFYYMPKKYKASMDENTKGAIIRLDKDMMIMIDNEEKSYWEMSFQEMEQVMKGMGAQMDAAEEQMKEAMKGMSEEQRKMVEEMMGKKKPAKGAVDVDVKKTGKTKTISGFACSEYTLQHGGKDLATVWATKDISGIEGMREDLTEFSKRMAAMMPPGMEGSVEKSLTKVDGFPIQTERSNGSVMTVTKVEKRSTPPSEFDAPKGYKKVDPPMGGHE